MTQEIEQYCALLMNDTQILLGRKEHITGDSINDLATARDNLNRILEI